MIERLKQPATWIFLAFLALACLAGYLVNILDFSPHSDNTPVGAGYPEPIIIENTQPAELTTPIDAESYKVHLSYDDIMPNRITGINIDLSKPVEVKYGQIYGVGFEATDPVQDLISPK